MPSPRRGNQRTEGAPPSGWWRLTRRNWTEPLTLTIRWCGGESGWIEVKTRGRTKRFTADTWLVDVVAEINSRADPATGRDANGKRI